jgi:hypothetical protein
MMEADAVHPLARRIVHGLVEDLYRKKVWSNLTRPAYVERLVAQLLGDGWQCVGTDWSGWDIEHATTKCRIEVKQSAARQPWTDGPGRTGNPTKPVFDIKERTGYYAHGGAAWTEYSGRPADLYVFAWHDVFEPVESVDHTDPRQWEFYLVPEHCLPKGRKTISLSSVKKLDPTCASCHDLGSKLQALMPSITPLKADSPQL